MHPAPPGGGRLYPQCALTALYRLSNGSLGSTCSGSRTRPRCAPRRETSTRRCSLSQSQSVSQSVSFSCSFSCAHALHGTNQPADCHCGALGPAGLLLLLLLRRTGSGGVAVRSWRPASATPCRRASRECASRSSNLLDSSRECASRLQAPPADGGRGRGCGVREWRKQKGTYHIHTAAARRTAHGCSEKKNDEASGQLYSSILISIPTFHLTAKPA